MYKVTDSVHTGICIDEGICELRGPRRPAVERRQHRVGAGGAALTEGRRRASDDVVIAIDHVTKRFGAFVAVDDADFAIARGEFFSMLGPSGCGKTTTLRMIAGFEQPSEGEIRLEGSDVSKVPPYKRNVNTVFQQYALFPHMSVRGQRRVRAARPRRSAKAEIDEAGRRAPRDRAARATSRNAQAGAALRRPAAARRPRPRARELPERAAARRAARRARPQAPPGDAARAQAHPARGRHHVHLRDPRSGRGAHDERPDRGHERGPGRADRLARGDLPRARDRVRRRLHRHGEPAPGARSRRATAALRSRPRRRRPRWSRAPAVDGLDVGDAGDADDPARAHAPPVDEPATGARPCRPRWSTSCSRAPWSGSTSRAPDGSRARRPRRRRTRSCRCCARATRSGPCGSTEAGPAAPPLGARRDRPGRSTRSKTLKP